MHKIATKLKKKIAELRNNKNSKLKEKHSLKTKNYIVKNLKTKQNCTTK